MTTRCKLLCDDLDSGADFLAFYRHSSISCGICESLQQTISGKLLAIGFAAMMRLLSNYFGLLFVNGFIDSKCEIKIEVPHFGSEHSICCLLYTSDAADE